jgi:hypothetical protein
MPALENDDAIVNPGPELNLVLRLGGPEMSPMTTSAKPVEPHAALCTPVPFPVASVPLLATAPGLEEMLYPAATIVIAGELKAVVTVTAIPAPVVAPAANAYQSPNPFVSIPTKIGTL